MTRKPPKRRAHRRVLHFLRPSVQSVAKITQTPEYFFWAGADGQLWQIGPGSTMLPISQSQPTVDRVRPTSPKVLS
jgi:hypothetical protein